MTALQVNGNVVFGLTIFPHIFLNGND